MNKSKLIMIYRLKYVNNNIIKDKVEYIKNCTNINIDIKEILNKYNSYEKIVQECGGCEYRNYHTYCIYKSLHKINVILIPKYGEYNLYIKIYKQ